MPNLFYEHKVIDKFSRVVLRKRKRQQKFKLECKS